MSRREGVRIEILVEDSRLERFVRHGLYALGFKRHEVIIEPYPSGQGSAKQWVTTMYPEFVKRFRSRKDQQNLVLLVGTEADEMTIHRRASELDEALRSTGQPARGHSEKLVHWIPKWNIETWLLYFQSEEVDEGTDSKQRVREPIPFPEIAKAFVREFRQSRNPDMAVDTLPSLRLAYQETNRFIP